MTPKANYSVTRINPETLTFAIQVQDAFNCSAGEILQFNHLSPFKGSSGCNESSNSTSDPGFEDSLIKEIEIRWDPPLKRQYAVRRKTAPIGNIRLAMSGKMDIGSAIAMGPIGGFPLISTALQVRVLYLPLYNVNALQ